MKIQIDKNTQYYGKDAEHFLESVNYGDCIEYLGKECITKYNHEGIIIGVEDNIKCNDYYFIVYLPIEDNIVFELINNMYFIESIKI